jgi:hypothetical protein
VLYGFEAEGLCLLIRVRNGYVVETPTISPYRWIRGQHIDTLADFFTTVKPLRIVATA